MGLFSRRRSGDVMSSRPEAEGSVHKNFAKRFLTIYLFPREDSFSPAHLPDLYLYPISLWANKLFILQNSALITD